MFDPQRLATPTGVDEWWVNILAPVTSTSSARTVAEYFSSAATGGVKQTTGDTYFPTEASNALAGYFLAAAVSGGDLLHVMGWLRQPIFTVAELVAFPRHRAIVLSSGNEATLIRTVPWMNGPHAADIKASLATYQPVSDAAQSELRTTQARIADTLANDPVSETTRIAAARPAPPAWPPTPPAGASPAEVPPARLPDPWAASAALTDPSRGDPR